MKIIQGCWIAFLALAGCGDRESSSKSPSAPGDDSPVSTFMRAIESKGEIVFHDSAKAGVGPDSSSCELRFSKDSRLIMHGYAYDIRVYRGAYDMNENGELTIRLGEEETSWPTLILSVEEDQFVLSRKDGLRSFKEYWNLYPEVVEKVFPLREKKAH